MKNATSRVTTRLKKQDEEGKVKEEKSENEKTEVDQLSVCSCILYHINHINLFRK